MNIRATAIITTLGIATVSLLSFPSTSVAEEVRIPVGSQENGASAKPRHGTTKPNVEAQFGEPISRRGPIGDPAIYYWEYESFTVYFENDHVIHTVSKVKSKTPFKK